MVVVVVVDAVVVVVVAGAMPGSAVHAADVPTATNRTAAAAARRAPLVIDRIWIPLIARGNNPLTAR